MALWVHPKVTVKIDGFKVIDIYRRGEGKLAENWIFIDILSILYQQGIDVFGQNDQYGFSGYGYACRYSLTKSWRFISGKMKLLLG